MALPTMTQEQRKANLEKAAETRAERAKLRAKLKASEIGLAELFATDTVAAQKMRVKSALTAIPGIGKTTADKMMAEARIHSQGNRRIQGLGDRQREKLIELTEHVRRG